MQERPHDSDAEKLEINQQIQQFLELQQALALQKAESQSTPPVDLFTSSHKLAESMHINDFYLIPEAVPARGRTVTVYLCGTCAKQTDYANARFFAGENVSQTFTINQGRNNVDKIIVDGPGSGENDAAALWIPYKPYSDLSGQAIGSGVTERIDHILAVLKNEPKRELSGEDKLVSDDLRNINREQPITRINIVGWSRGAAAGITLANRIATDAGLNHIDMNMVLLDPVPGAGVAMAFQNKLPAQVKNCYVIYAEDERSAFFNPAIPDCPPGCNYVPTVMPGGHAHVAGDEADHAGIKMEGANLQGVGIVSRYMMQHILRHLGTRLDQDKMSKMTLKNLLEHYEQIMQNRAQYRQVAQRVAYVGFNQLAGETRKVIEGNSKLFNQYFSDVRAKRFPPHDGRYLDYTHERMAIVTEQAAKFVVAFTAILDARLNVLKPLDASDLNLFLERIQSHAELENSPLLCRAISEELQTRYKPDDLQNINHRCHTKEELSAYAEQLLHEIADIHARKLQIDEMQKKNTAGLQQLYERTGALEKNYDTNLKRLQSLESGITERKNNYKDKHGDEIEACSHIIDRTKKLLTNAGLPAVKAHFNSVAAGIRTYNAECAEYVSMRQQILLTMESEIQRLNPEANLQEATEALKKFERQLIGLGSEHENMIHTSREIKRDLRTYEVRKRITEISSHVASLEIMVRRFEASRRKLEFTPESAQPSETIVREVVGKIDMLEEQVGLLKSAIADSARVIAAARAKKSDIVSPFNVPDEALRTQLENYDVSLQQLSTMEKSMAERRQQFSAMQKQAKEMAISAHECTRIYQGYFRDDLSRLSTELQLIKTDVERTIGQFSSLPHSLAVVEQVNESTIEGLTQFRRAVANGEAAIKTQLLTLLQQECRRIHASHSRFISFNDLEKTNDKLAAVVAAISRIESAGTLSQITDIANELLRNNTVTRSRRRCDSLLRRLSIFGNGSTLKQRLEAFTRAHGLEQPAGPQQERDVAAEHAPLIVRRIS